MGRGTSYALAAIIGASVVTGCSVQHANAGGRSGSASPTGSAQQAAARCSATPHRSGGTVTISNPANGKVLCLRTGTQLAVFLHGSQSRKWSQIRAASAVLRPVPNGSLTLMIGVTGAFFRAVRPGVTTVTSSLPSCPATASATPSPTPSAGPRCRMGTVFHVTVVVRGQ